MYVVRVFDQIDIQLPDRKPGEYGDRQEVETAWMIGPWGALFRVTEKLPTLTKHSANCERKLAGPRLR